MAKKLIDMTDLIEWRGQESGVQEAARLCTELLPFCEKLNQLEIADMCRIAIKITADAPIEPAVGHTISASQTMVDAISQSASTLSRVLATPAKTDQKPKDTAGVPNRIPLTSFKMDSKNHAKNFSLRFNYEEMEVKLDGDKKFSVARSRKAIGRYFASQVPIDDPDYEDVIDESILQAPICDIQIMQSGEGVPSGFYRISKNMRNKKAVLNAGVAGSNIYLCIRKATSIAQTPITALLLVYPDRGENIPPGYYGVKRFNKYELWDLNVSTNSSYHERVYLCYRKDLYGNPIIDLQLITRHEECPPNFTRMDRSQKSSNASTNIGTTGHKIFIAYRTYIERLECLWNEEIFFNKFGTDPSNLQFSGQVILKKFNFDSTDNCIVETPETRREIKRFSLMIGDVEYDDTLGGGSPPRSEDSPRSPRGRPKRLSICGDLRSDIVVIDSQGEIVSFEKRRLLHPLLSALYIRNVYKEIKDFEVSTFALDGLILLMRRTDFFEDDLNERKKSSLFSVTMLDLTVDAICDHMESICQDSHQDKVLEFMSLLIKHSQGTLSDLSIHRIYKTLSFLCSLHLTYHQNWVDDEVSPPLFMEKKDKSKEPIIEQIPSFYVMKLLIESSNLLCEREAIAHSLPSALFSIDYGTNVSESFKIIHELVLDLADDVADSVLTSRLCESACILVAKQSLSVQSHDFFSQSIALGEKILSVRALKASFLILCIICKQAWNHTKKNSHHRDNSDKIASNREVGNRLVGFECLIVFCEKAGSHLANSKIFGYLIRRMVVSCILSNAGESMKNHRLFTKIMRLINVLWRVWRAHIRLEFALLSEFFIVRLLQASSVQVSPEFQMTVIEEVVHWFDQPHLLVEMFVNFDMDRNFVANWNIFADVIRALCSIASNSAHNAGAWEFRQDSDANGKQSKATVRECNMAALDEAAHIAKTIMDASGTGYYMVNDEKFRLKQSHRGYGWEEDEQNKNLNKMRFTVRDMHDHNLAVEEHLKRAIKICQEKKSLKKSVEYMIKNGLLAESPQEIANFIRIYKNSFDPVAIGDYLGEGDPVKKDVENFYKQIRYRYTKAVSFVEMHVEPALRLYLSGCGFRLPGEAQRIDRLMTSFAHTFWEDNHDTPFCPIDRAEDVYLLAFAVIMLQTDLHGAQTQSKGNKHKKMTKEQFCNNLRGGNNGQDFPRKMLSDIYDSIEAEKIDMNAISGLKAHDDNRLSYESDPALTSENTQFMHDVYEGMRDSEDLMRSLAPFQHGFQLTGIDTNISLDLVSFMFEAVYTHFYELVGELLQSLNKELHITFAALDILSHCLCSSIFLGLKEQTRTFGKQLLRFKQAFVPENGSADVLLANLRASGVYSPQGIKLDAIVPDAGYSESWYALLTSEELGRTAIDDYSLVVATIKNVKEKVEILCTKKATNAVILKIEKRAKVHEENKYLVREGDLLKINRSGGMKLYRFFLFSNYLYYAHLTFFNEYRVHTKLSLLDLTVTDVENDEKTKTYSFRINHPTKSFVIVAEEAWDKYMWVKEIMQTVSSCKAKMRLQSEKPSDSMIDRIEGQIEQQHDEVRKRSICITDRIISTRYKALQFDENGIVIVSDHGGSSPNTPRSSERVAVEDEEVHHMPSIQESPEGSQASRKNSI